MVPTDPHLKCYCNGTASAASAQTFQRLRSKQSALTSSCHIQDWYIECGTAHRATMRKLDIGMGDLEVQSCETIRLHTPCEYSILKTELTSSLTSHCTRAIVFVNVCKGLQCVTLQCLERGTARNETWWGTECCGGKLCFVMRASFSCVYSLQLSRAHSSCNCQIPSCFTMPHYLGMISQ